MYVLPEDILLPRSILAADRRVCAELDSSEPVV